MSGDCEKCGNHALECSCLNTDEERKFAAMQIKEHWERVEASDGYKVAVQPQKCLCIHALDGYETYKIDDNTIGVRPFWVSVKDRPAPKEGKFLFYYHYGIGLGSWGQAYTIFNGNSERTHEIYFLVLCPMDISEDSGEPMQWDESKMIEMDVFWMPLPLPPKDEK